MNKIRRGDMPPPEKVTFHGYDPLHGEKLQLGFEQDNIQSGNLRHHNGAVATGLPGHTKTKAGMGS